MMEKSRGSNFSFLLGAGVLFAGMAAERLFRSLTVENARELMYLAEEARDRYLEKPRRTAVIPPMDRSDEMPDLRTPNYDPYFDREAAPTPPPSYENFRPPVPVAISPDEDDFYARINEEVMKGNSVLDGWLEA